MSDLKKVLELSIRLRDLAPWNFVRENDIFGVQVPRSGAIYLVSIMGADHIHYALAAYEGARGLASFWDLCQDDPWARSGELLLIPHLMVSFENREMIDPALLRQLKELGFQIRGRKAWPDLKQNIPGFVPELPSDEALTDLVHILGQAIEVMERAKKDPSFLFNDEMDEEDYLLRVPSPGSPSGWKDSLWRFEEPVLNYKIIYNPALQKQLASRPRSQKIFQADIAFLGNIIREPGRKGGFAMAFILAEKKTGIIMKIEVLDSRMGTDQVYERFPALLLESLVKSEILPATVEIRHPLLAQMAERVLHSTKIKLIFKRKLEAVDEFLGSWEENNKAESRQFKNS